MDAPLPNPWNAGGKSDLTAPPPPIKGQACNTSGESYVTARWRNPITVFIQTITVRTKILQLYLSIILQYAWGEQRSEQFRGDGLNSHRPGHDQWWGPKLSKCGLRPPSSSTQQVWTPLLWVTENTTPDKEPSGLTFSTICFLLPVHLLTETVTIERASHVCLSCSVSPLTVKLTWYEMLSKSKHKCSAW